MLLRVRDDSELAIHSRNFVGVWPLLLRIVEQALQLRFRARTAPCVVLRDRLVKRLRPLRFALGFSLILRVHPRSPTAKSNEHKGQRHQYGPPHNSLRLNTSGPAAGVKPAPNTPHTPRATPRPYRPIIGRRNAVAYGPCEQSPSKSYSSARTGERKERRDHQEFFRVERCDWEWRRGWDSKRGCYESQRVATDCKAEPP